MFIFPVFNYNPRFHNVLRVSHAEYQACNASSPMSTHTTGNDSIMIDTHGHHFFMCGVPTHCQAGQKVDINVPRPPSVGPAQSASSSPPPVVNSPVPIDTVQAPSPSAAATPIMQAFAINFVGFWVFLA
ncbi:Cupredoxin superfamily protein [Striga hermonthica]|uniref:Cupredoxin superfamily protein n=1 Tax=Striga hermonthica TaxID=68872 RepID=A0A9N7NSP7_STRHE|nr:Cupredoxin superfamily protein [Striga hermonthica]